MLSSVLGILICGICLSGLTWAWFSGSVTSTAKIITTANFSVVTTFKNSNDETVDLPMVNDIYTLESGEYKVTVTASGTASTGYCMIDLDGKTYHTIQLFTGTEHNPRSLAFTVNASEGSKLTITSQWGTYAKPEDEVLIGNSEDDIDTLPISSSLSLLEVDTEKTQTYHLTESEQSYTIQLGDTLSKIANRYGTTVAVLSTYNNITNPNTIQAGSTVKIPPVSYTIPETTSTQSAATESTATEPSATETPKQTEESSSTVFTKPSLQETVQEGVDDDLPALEIILSTVE